jgi:hypothetical protein
MYKPFEPYTGTKFGVGGITSIKVQLANTAWNSVTSNLQCCLRETSRSKCREVFLHPVDIGPRRGYVIFFSYICKLSKTKNYVT